MSASLPSRPDLNWLKNRAKDRLAELRASDPAAKLADAQRDVARTYGFPSWRALKAHVDAARTGAAEVAAPDDVVRAFFEAVGTGKLDGVRAALDRTPGFVQAVGPHPFWGGRPQALHVAIESDRRRGDGPAAETPLHSAAWNGDLAMARLLVEAGADTGARDRQYDGTPLGWAETAHEITNNPACGAVATFLRDRA